MTIKPLDPAQCEDKTWGEIVRHYKPDATNEEIDHILWNETCYPFDYETTIHQLNRLFNAK